MVFPFYLRRSVSSGSFASDSPITIFPFLAYLQHVPLLSFITLKVTFMELCKSLAVPSLYALTSS